mgnify:CR=1 FL=1
MISTPSTTTTTTTTFRTVLYCTDSTVQYSTKLLEGSLQKIIRRDYVPS